MTLFVAEAGDRGAPAVVLLHGAGTSGWMWARQAAVLAGELHLLIPDLPGHGRSNGIPWTSIADTATAVTDLVAERTADGRAHVVGLSLGGYVGLHLAAGTSWPTGLIVSGSSVLPFPNRRLIRLITAAMTPFLRSSALLRANAKVLRVPAEDFADYRAAALATNGRTVRRVTAEATSFRLPAGAGTSDCPVLAVAGGDEHELVRRSVPVIAAGFPHGEGRLITGVGHAWNGERPDVFSAMIKARVLGGELPESLQPVDPEPA
ncbi:alpha/beta fold hydrolase [Microlunatus speluncae]|uniref:alpha/beta fold hydrolase n=1 Tax=Microlunatus speluncae TaxID=2594267 RepID=UPI001375D6A1|nr:alpha/beta fold hydrolase [Microlunatus speluncae]